MSGMPAGRAARGFLVLVALLVSTALVTPPASADDVDPQAPVVVDDTVTMWPGQSMVVDVVANDSDPGGDELAPCRLPSVDPLHAPVQVEAGEGTDQPGSLVVSTRPRSHGTHTVHYYVCSHTRLTPATLTVVIRPTAPVDVVADPDRPGVLTVTNENDQRIRFLGANGRGCRLDLQMWVGPHRTRSIHVTRHDIRWLALIGGNAVVDNGHVRHIELDGPPASADGHSSLCLYSFERSRA